MDESKSNPNGMIIDAGWPFPHFFNLIKTPDLWNLTIYSLINQGEPPNRQSPSMAPQPELTRAFPHLTRLCKRRLNRTVIRACPLSIEWGLGALEQRVSPSLTSVITLDIALLISSICILWRSQSIPNKQGTTSLPAHIVTQLEGSTFNLGHVCPI